MALSHPDPWAYTVLGRGIDGPAFLWHEPAGKTLATFGLAAALPGADDDDVRALCSMICEQDGATTTRPPLVVGGFGFGGHRVEVEGEALWSGWA
ncbi:MAG: hypothetical protein QF464_12820, partial [Myxococcota bacterium]|nr:hypothetical protein [Myxococcota bacterium]